MAITNHERVGKSLDLLRDGLRPYVERELENRLGEDWRDKIKDILEDPHRGDGKSDSLQDVSVILIVMDRKWGDVFRRTLGRAERSMVNEMIDTRNRWAHQEQFSSDTAYRALDSVGRLLSAVSAPEADDVEKMKMDLLRVRFDDQRRSEKRRDAASTIESQVTGSLKPWREVVAPHKDVASGNYQQAEFAADLWQVYLGEGSDEYKNPAEFFRRTFLTQSLEDLLADALRRICKNGGAPVVQLQTNFGGGKTHSMLALYHLFSGTKPGKLADIDRVLEAAEAKDLPHVKRVVLVGNKLSPGNPVTKPDGTVVRTLWGEMAWQLGGRAAYDRIRADDEKATSPGDVLKELLNEYGPCLILIDEWVSYARQLHDGADLPGGDFETHFTFALSITEATKAANNCLLVVSLPASDTSGSPHTVADDVEVGGERGRLALDRLRNAVGRVESSWRPATAQEGFEIVRRRLFEPLGATENHVARDSVVRAFADMYRAQKQEFPSECHEGDYEERLKAAYPIHPEVFDRLYTDWSTLIKFQRTRGVLRLMAAVIHSLYESGDRNPLIMPGNIPIDDRRVQFELTRYLSDNWPPVIEKDVDGPNSLPQRIDGEVPNLGKFAACRRVARTIYLGSAPTATAANVGLEDRRIKLGCVMPGESPNVFGDALRRLGDSATYLYQDGAKYWYSTQPTVTKLADDRAEQFKRAPDAVSAELDKRLRADLRNTGDLSRVHALPRSGQDVPDDTDARLVVLGLDQTHSKESDSPAIVAAKKILESRGNSPRLFRNALVFVAVDQTRLQDLDEAVRRYLAWESIVAEKDELDLTAQQVKQAENRRASADGVVVARIPEAYQWLIVPEQSSAQGEIEWQAYKLTGSDPLAVRASKKLRTDELLVTALAGTRLRMELDRVLWRDNDNVPVRQLAEDFAKYLYLPRLKNSEVLNGAVYDGLGLVTWNPESFAYADSYDDAAGRYVGLRSGQDIGFGGGELPGLLVKPEVAVEQLKAERPADGDDDETGDEGETPSSPPGDSGGDIDGVRQDSPSLKRFHGAISLNPERVGRDASRVAEEVIAHLSGLVGAEVEVTLEISAVTTDGVPTDKVRTITENCGTLKFSQHGFERE